MLAEKAAGPVLFPCGEAHREELPSVLRSAGVLVDEVVCYRSVLADITDARVAAELGTILIVASPTVANLLAQACPRGGNRPGLLAVGPTTADAARAAGWPPAAVASEPSARGLAAAVKGLLENR
jgi:uroporphyrinogen-III synthase